MRSPQRVVWSEGMLVSPQHLQQADLYHERLLDGRLAAVAPYTWGVLSVELDAAALAAEQIRLVKFAGILPDGLLARFEGGDPESPPLRPIQGHFPPTHPALDVYLGAVKERDGVPSVGAPPKPGDGPRTSRTRFRAATRVIADLTGDGADLDMGFAERNLVVLFGDEPRDDYDTIKIAEIVRDGSGRLALNEAYIPPVLRIGASGFIMEAIRRLLGTMTTKQRQLAGERRQRDPAAVEFDTNDVTRYLQLHTLNSAVPVLTELSRAGAMSPHDFYMFLVQIAGQLTTFTAGEDPTKLPAFLYNDLRATFEELFAKTTALLQVTARAGSLPVPLEVNQGLYIGRLTADHVGKCGQFVLAVQSDLPESELSHRLPGICKIASYNQLPYILRAATPGIPLRLVQRPPSEVPIRPGVVYFMLDIGSDYWKAVTDERTVAIYMPPPFDPTRVKLDLHGVPRAG